MRHFFLTALLGLRLQADASKRRCRGVTSFVMECNYNVTKSFCLSLTSPACNLFCCVRSPKMCHQDVKKVVRASHIKDVIYQSPCFSETMVMSIILYPLIEWKSLVNNASHSRVPSIIISFYHPSQKLRH